MPSTFNLLNLEDSDHKNGGRTGQCLCCWGILTTVCVIGLTIALIVVSLNKDNTISDSSSIRWCTINDEEQAKCQQMKAAFQNAGLIPEVKCVNRQSTELCIQSIQEGTVDALTVDGGHLFSGQDLLKPVVAEDYGYGDATYWAVAVVKKSDRSINLTIEGLQGKYSCHTGFQKSAGWNMPMGKLKTLGIISGCDIKTSAINLFGKICAPNNNGDQQLCTGCQGSCQRSCGGEAYCGYTGAFRCMVERGDVAFVKHTTIFKNTDGNNREVWAQHLLSSNYELLCPDGSRASPSNYEACNLGKVPAHAVVMSTNASSSTVTRVMELLYVAQIRFGSHTNGKFQLFGGSSKDLLFKSTTKLLLPLQTDCTSQRFLGSSYLANMHSLQCEDVKPVPSSTSCVFPQYSSSTQTTFRWCVTSAAEMAKCDNVSRIAQTVGSSLDITCVAAKDSLECALMVHDGVADAVSLDRGHIYEAGTQYNLQPLAAEYYGGSGNETTASYFGVAVIKSSDTSTRFSRTGLQGKKTCHTGYQRTAGWDIPVGRLITSGIISYDNSACNVADQVANFFGGSCIPGIQGSTTTSDVSKTKLCRLCNGTGADNCDFSKEPYSGYSGAFRCLEDGAGDIAFVKHATVLAPDVNQSNYMLLCPNGDVKAPKDYLECNIGRAAAHALMISPTHKTLFREKVWALLNQLQRLGNFNLFSSKEFGGNDLLFKDSSKCLWKVDNKCTWADYLGQNYVDATNDLRCQSSHADITTKPCTFVQTCVDTRPFRN